MTEKEIPRCILKDGGLSTPFIDSAADKNIWFKDYALQKLCVVFIESRITHGNKSMVVAARYKSSRLLSVCLSDLSLPVLAVLPSPQLPVLSKTVNCPLSPRKKILHRTLFNKIDKVIFHKGTFSKGQRLLSIVSEFLKTLAM